MLILTWQACKPVDESVVKKSSDAIATERRKLLEKMLLEYLQRLKETRIDQVIDPHQEQNFEVSVRDTQVYGSKTLTQVSWKRVQADKIEVLRCELLEDSSGNTCRALAKDFADLEEEPNACGYKECTRVREKIHDGTRLIDHSIVATLDSAKSFHYLVRPCFENYLLVGKGKSETLVKCGADAIKNANANSVSGRYIAQRACGEESVLICGKPSLGDYSRGKGISSLSGAELKKLRGLYDQREEIIAELEKLAEKMVLEAQAGLQESLKWEDKTRDQRIAMAKQILLDQSNIEITNAQTPCLPPEPEEGEEEDKSLWENVTATIKDPVFWQLAASAPFLTIAEAPECHQAQKYAEQSYAADVSKRLGEGAVSDEGRHMARNLGYIECANENIGTLIGYYEEVRKSGKELTAYDASVILDAGISMIPLPNSELNSRSTQEAVFMSLNTLLSDPPKRTCNCPTCMKNVIKLRTYDQQRIKLNLDLRATITLIQNELTRRGIKNPYAEANN